jgi:prefoldin beta subunit
MEVPVELEEKIARLQMLEQNIQAFSSQRQSFQLQMGEIDNALKELDGAKEKPFKVIGNLMIATETADLKKELSSQKEVMELRVKNLEKQESKLKEKAEELQKEVMSAIQQKGGK